MFVHVEYVFVRVIVHATRHLHAVSSRRGEGELPHARIASIRDLCDSEF